MMVIESMDADTETRRVSPLALVGGDNRSVMDQLTILQWIMSLCMSLCPSFVTPYHRVSLFQHFSLVAML